MRLLITYRRSAYYVSVPNYAGGPVVTLDEVEQIEAKLRDTETNREELSKAYAELRTYTDALEANERELRDAIANSPGLVTEYIEKGKPLEIINTRAIDAEEKLAIVLAARVLELESHRETVHQCPPLGSDRMPCCGRNPLDVSRSDRLTTDEVLVTCRRSHAAIALVRNKIAEHGGGPRP